MACTTKTRKTKTGCKKQDSGVSFFLLLLLLNLTGPNWGRWEMQKGQSIRQTDMQKVGIRCAGGSDGDAQQSCCFFSLITLL
jgi:hypothetical protein